MPAASFDFHRNATCSTLLSSAAASASCLASTSFSVGRNWLLFRKVHQEAVRAAFEKPFLLLFSSFFNIFHLFSMPRLAGFRTWSVCIRHTPDIQCNIVCAPEYRLVYQFFSSSKLPIQANGRQCGRLAVWRSNAAVHSSRAACVEEQVALLRLNAVPMKLSCCPGAISAGESLSLLGIGRHLPEGYTRSGFYTC